MWLFEHMYEHRNYTDILMKTDKLYLLEEEFHKRLFAQLSDTASPWEIVYQTGGVYNLFVYWAKNGYRETPQEVAALVKKTKRDRPPVTRQTVSCKGRKTE